LRTPSAREVNAGQSPADIFWAIDAGSIGIVAENDATVSLPDHLVSEIPDTYHPTDQWVGVMGRARSIPYNTEEFSESEIPNDILTFAQDSRFNNAMGWAPTYGAFQAFVTAMRLIDGESEARQWLNGMQEQGVNTYDNELVVANRVASGELSAGFSNHYYSRLVFEERPNALIDLAFTQGDAGALVNCSGTEIIKNTAKRRWRWISSITCSASRPKSSWRRGVRISAAPQRPADRRPPDYRRIEPTGFRSLPARGPRADAATHARGGRTLTCP